MKPNFLTSTKQAGYSFILSGLALAISTSSWAATSTFVLQELEPGFCSVDGTIDSNNAGFTGNGFANSKNATGAMIKWAVNASESSRYTLTFRYANGGSGNRKGTLLLNDGANGSYTLDMPSTGSWTKWQTVSIDVDLVQDNNNLQLTALTADGLANIDSLSILGAKTSAGICGAVASSSSSSSSKPAVSSSSVALSSKPAVSSVAASSTPKSSTPSVSSSSSSSATATELLAFPTAEGYGKHTTGGRGGAVYEVTNLNDSGAGSLRAAVSASGARTIVFRVSGTIDLQSNLTISNPNITIAGQTAPGDGITLKRYPLVINADNVIIRYIRSRYGDLLKNDADAVSMRYRKNIILDHISASWGDDESMSIYHGENVTIQWSMITETLNRGGDHGFAGIWGSPYSSHHHNLIAHNVSRAIRFASGGGNVDYRNNVIYNWGYNSAYGGEQQQVGNANFNFSNINMVANYYKPGPATENAVRSRILNPTTRNGDADYGHFYVADNYMVGNSRVTADNWDGGVQPAVAAAKLTKPWPSMPIKQETAEQAYLSVLAKAGASKVRDSVDTRIIEEVRNGTATYGKNGIIESQQEVGGWPSLKNGTAPQDSDKDGMPDDWENANGLNPSDASDRNKKDGVGYTMLEKYLNSLI
ncbi:carbohydrate-binding protein [Cellvibrio sp. OA-2007]|uniref:carbohydrate-binding protein n=1 Tax=Cellvibrio sp. OA-2007 TaxID=529823 RepID=UPI000ACB9089|nr:carbohydrate-binding protein [Cellvibrio sp. OA-2007]